MRTEVKLITPAIAEEYLKRNRSNRKINEKTVRFYSDQMKRGQFMTTGQGLSFDENNNLMDGQHRLNAIIHSKVSIPMLLIFGVDSRAFEVYDGGKNRAVGDVFHIGGIPDPFNTSATITKYLTLRAGVKLLSGPHVKESYISKHDCIQKYHEMSEFWSEIVRFENICYDKLHLYSKPQIGAIAAYLILDHKKRKEQVFQFFYQIFSVEDDELKCTKMLREYIIKDALGMKRTPLGIKITMIFKAWNLYVRKAKSGTILASASDPYPEIL